MKKRPTTYRQLLDINDKIRQEKDEGKLARLLDERREMERDYILCKHLELTLKIENLAAELQSLPSHLTAAQHLLPHPPVVEVKPPLTDTFPPRLEIMERLTEVPQGEVLYQKFENELSAKQRARVHKYFPRAQAIGYIWKTESGWRCETSKRGQKALFGWFIREVLRPDSREQVRIPYAAIERLFDIPRLDSTISQLMETRSSRGVEYLREEIFYD